MNDVKLKFNDIWVDIEDGWFCIGDGENQILLKPEYFNKVLERSANMKRWGFDATTYPYRTKLISCKWVKKPPTAPLIYICCCVQYGYDSSIL